MTQLKGYGKGSETKLIQSLKELMNHIIKI